MKLVTRSSARWVLTSLALVGAMTTAGVVHHKRLARLLHDPTTPQSVSVPVSVHKAAPTPERTFVGVLLPPQMANVSPQADGKLIELPAHVGQTVKKGDTLAVFDAREKQQELAAATALLKAAKGSAAAAGAELHAARSRAARRTAKVAVGGREYSLVSSEEALQSVYDAQGAAGRAAAAAGQVAEQTARIAALKIALEETTLRAPFDGVVTGTYCEPGINIHAKETVVRVVGGGDGLRLRMALPEEETTIAQAKGKALLTLEDGRKLTANLARVSPEVDPITRTFFMEGDVDLAVGEEGQAKVLAGKTVRAAIASNP
jgi:RND family efflux transporter MFP subunit